MLIEIKEPLQCPCFGKSIIPSNMTGLCYLFDRVCMGDEDFPSWCPLRERAVRIEDGIPVEVDLKKLKRRKPTVILREVKDE